MIKNENGGFGSVLKAIRGHDTFSGVSCALSATLVDIILIMRHAPPLLTVSHSSYLGEFKSVGDSCKCEGDWQENRAIIPGLPHIM